MKQDTAPINTVLPDLDGTLYDPTPAREALITSLEGDVKRVLLTAGLMGGSVDEIALTKLCYDILKVRSDPRKAEEAERDLSCFTERAKGAGVSLDTLRTVVEQSALPYTIFMNETLFKPGNRERFYVPFEGPVETLEELRARGYILGVVTNGESIPQRRKIASLGLNSYFDFVQVSADPDVCARKPSMTFFRRAIEQAQFAGYLKHDPVIVNETTALMVDDLEASFPEQQTGITLVKFRDRPSERKYDCQKAEYHISNLRELSRILRI